MNATSLVRPWLWLLAAPVLIFGLSIAIPADSEGAETSSNSVRLAPRGQADAKKADTKKGMRNSKDQDKNKKKKATKAKKHHKHHKHHKKHHKHHKKHHKHKRGSRANAEFENRVQQDVARLQRDEQMLQRDTARLRKALR